jgi:UDP-N-acetylmuramate--alanine ligase
MNLFFCGIGGAGIGPLALLAHQAGYDVAGSDKQNSSYIDHLKKAGIESIYIGQSKEQLAAAHAAKPIDWFIYTSALTMENPDPPELQFCREQKIKTSKRDEFINAFLNDKNLDMVAIAGTHGKTSTTAMLVWLLKQSNTPISYLLAAKVDFAEVAEYNPKAKYFIYEADEFDRNFLNFEPKISLITGVSWDHHEIFPTREDYQQAFVEFISQSGHTFIWQEDQEYLNAQPASNISILSSQETAIQEIKLFGQYNRLDAYLAVSAAKRITNTNLTELLESVSKFPGLQRRMEPIIPNLYTDYAHTPEKIRGAMSVALEMAAQNNQAVVVVYEPLTNRRQYYMAKDYKDCFNGAKVVYWLPSYLAREDPKMKIIKPEELIQGLDDPTIAQPLERDETLRKVISNHLENGDMVVCMNGGGGDSLDDWLRVNFKGSNG